MASASASFFEAKFGASEHRCSQGKSARRVIVSFILQKQGFFLVSVRLVKKRCKESKRRERGSCASLPYGVYRFQPV